MSEVRKYRKRPVVVEAVRWAGGMDGALELWLGESFNSWLPSINKLEIRTLEGPLTASAGDYIIRGVQGEFYPCKPDIFEATYEEADDDHRRHRERLRKGATGG